MDEIKTRLLSDTCDQITLQSLEHRLEIKQSIIDIKDLQIKEMQSYIDFLKEALLEKIK
jgi:hypothetical protein